MTTFAPKTILTTGVDTMQKYGADARYQDVKRVFRGGEGDG